MSQNPKARLGDVSADSQRRRLLERLRIGPVDTFTAREELNVAHPAGRIQELREAGHTIHTHRRTIQDGRGHKHPSCAVYYLTEEFAAHYLERTA